MLAFIRDNNTAKSVTEIFDWLYEQLGHEVFTRACLKKAFRELRVPVCGRFYPNEGGVAGYGNRMRVKYTAKWGVQIAGMIFQTRSNTYANQSCSTTAFLMLISIKYG